MSTQVSAQPSACANDGTNAKRGGSRGRGGNKRGGNPKNTRGGGAGGAKSANGNPEDVKEKEKEKVEEVDVQGQVEDGDNATTATVADTEAGEENVCWICAEPVKYWSVPECNHRTCHVCALRLRALYKKTDCTFCKEPQSSVIFTASQDTEFAVYSPEDIPYKDVKLEIYFETQEMMEETLILLKFNCPDPSCDFIANGWGDLKLHTRAVHGRLMCDLCIRNKKVFAHEHALYPPNVLPVHLPSMHHRYVKQVAKDKVEGGVHPICEFCKECFFGVDEHYSHMREKHEECFVCKRNGVQYQYFQNYESLERHFNTSHHPCTQPECRERKFVVFNTPLDLQAHMVEDHGASMSSRDKKDARKIQAEFQFEEVGARHGRRGGGGTRERDREPPPAQQQPRSQGGPSTATRPQPPANGRRAAFGSSLTPSEGAATPPHNPSLSGTSTPLMSDVDPSVAERHAAFISRLQSFTQNPTNAVPAVKAAIRGYRASESSARDLILTIFNVLDKSLEYTASIVNGLVDLFDEEEKKQDLLASWRGFNIEQRQQFPDLVPQTIGSEYAGITSGRVLNAKNSTASRLSQPSRQVLDRVAAAASSSSVQPIPKTRTERFPPLPGSNAAPIPAFRQPTRTTAWSASANTGGTRTPPIVVEPRSVPAAKVSQVKQPPPPKLNNTLFPELPSSAAARDKPKLGGNASLKNILGGGGPAVSAWQGGAGDGGGAPGSSNPPESTPMEGDEAENATKPAGKGKKGKGKQKQTLFTLGTFPA